MPKGNKVLVCITPQHNSRRLIEKGHVVARDVEGELHILHVVKGANILDASESPALLQELFDYASDLGGIVHGICGEEIFPTIKEFIRKQKITHVIVGEHPLQAVGSEDISARLRKAHPYLSVIILKREESI